MPKLGKEAHLRIHEVGGRHGVRELFDHYLKKVGVTGPEELTEGKIKAFLDYAEKNLPTMVGELKTGEIIREIKKELELE